MCGMAWLRSGAAPAARTGNRPSTQQQGAPSLRGPNLHAEKCSELNGDNFRKLTTNAHLIGHHPASPPRWLGYFPCNRSRALSLPLRVLYGSFARARGCGYVCKLEACTLQHCGKIEKERESLIYLLRCWNYRANDAPKFNTKHAHIFI